MTGSPGVALAPNPFGLRALRCAITYRMRRAHHARTARAPARAVRPTGRMRRSHPARNAPPARSRMRTTQFDAGARCAPPLGTRN